MATFQTDAGNLVNVPAPQISLPVVAQRTIFAATNAPAEQEPGAQMYDLSVFLGLVSMLAHFFD